jgi:pimeloyl-ACP methyl ester carboxylesterase/tetratricopeptide (TPR) repeat protein
MLRQLFARRIRAVMTAGLLVSALAAGSPSNAGAQDAAPFAPELAGLGTLHMPVTTSVDRAQRFFDQGMRLLYAFNHAEAIRAFREAARLDPQMAMAYWGQAVALGPNLNAPLTQENGRLAFEAAQRALAAAARTTPRERALIDAVVARYAQDGAGDRAALDRAYATAMRAAAARFVDDPDVQTLDADATMNTMPWDYWQKDGSAKPETSRVMASLESVIRRQPDHVGALHYHIHLLEASNDPDRAVSSADRLGALMPAAGHMVHMPAHIYIRVGRYADAAEANERAIRADEDYLAQCQAQGLYPVSYYPHNLHFLWAAATLEGRSHVAVEAARRVAEKVPHHHAGALAWTVDFPVTPLLAYTRFGRWQEVLTEPEPPANQPYARGIWHYARGLGFIARGHLDRSATELSALKALLDHEAFETTLKDLPLLTNLQMAARIVDGELAARRGDTDTAIRVLQEAVAIDDGLPYSEPPLWHQPPRQVLGAVLVESGRAEEAEAVYREDLKRFRENGWSLFGLMQSLRAQNRASEAAEIQRRFETAWSRSDITLTSSRIMSDTRAVPSTAATTARETHGHHSHAHAAPSVASIDLPHRTRLEYVEQGDASGIPVILLHGYSDSRRSYELVLPHLPPSLHVFAITQRGHGNSGRPAHGYEAGDFAQDVAAFMDGVGLDSAVIVGHSMGATVAQRFAVDYPERTRALVLEGAFVPRPTNAGVHELWKTVSALRDPVDPGFVREFQQSTLARSVPPEFLEGVVTESLKVPARVWQEALRPFLTLDFLDEIGAIQAPTLLVWGDRDAFTLRADQATLNEAIDGSRLIVYGGTGHCPHWEEPTRFASDLHAFIEALAARP